MAKHGRKPLVLLGVLLLTSLLIAPDASPWGSAVHAYIDDHLGANRPVRNANEMYGGMAPDVFNYLFDHPDQLQFLYAQTHNNFMRLWEVAHRRLGRSVAFGFVSHNDVWGADSTAHHTVYSVQRTVRICHCEGPADGEARTSFRSRHF